MSVLHASHAENAVVYQSDPLYMQCSKNNS
jgi:hypothetical protein